MPCNCTALSCGGAQAYRFVQRPAAAPASADGFVEDGCRMVACPGVAAAGAARMAS